MTFIPRKIAKQLIEALKRGKSVLLLGARQTGKTTLIKHLNLKDLSFTLLDPQKRLQFEKSPHSLRQEILGFSYVNPNKQKPLITIDEIQKVPALMDVVQLMIDEGEAQFILTGSSVRKLRRHSQFNLLPGRVVNFHLDPLSLLEIPSDLLNLNTLLLDGSLPGIYLDKTIKDRQIDLQAYVSNYLEEEVRGEALVRQLGSFARFIELSAVENGNQINISKLSQELGISRHTLTEYFQILDDCLVAEKIESLRVTNSRRRLSRGVKYLYFDMGIRRIAANEGRDFSSKVTGNLFEQFIGLELIRGLRVMAPLAKLYFWRDHAGPEIDFVIEHNKKYLPIEVKWTEAPSVNDAKHLVKFTNEYDCLKPAIIVCRCASPLLVTDNVLALPWQSLAKIFDYL